ncbi:MAG: insulinase family protein [Acidobacteria bacterium]|nr:insulinase family protein [Acidobacteriota bacterium]
MGLTSAMTSMLSEGTKTRTSKQLAEEIERLGANVSASSNADNTVISASALSLYSSDILRLMAEITLFPTFPESELKLYKQNTIENLKFQRSQPGFLAEEQTARLLYGSHPYSITSPKPADVEKITRQELIQFHEKMFVPENAIFIVVGDANRESILKEIEENFGHWTQGSFEEMYFPMPPARTETTVTIVDRPGSAQSNIVLSNPALERTNPDYFPLLVMNQILGAGASSRLFMNLREEKGYTYGAYSSLDARRLAGAFEATSEVRTPVTGDSLKEFFYELNRIRDEKVSEGELKDAKNFLSGVFPIRVETQEGLTNLIVSQQLYNLPADYLQTYRHKINEITIEDVERAAKKYITPEKLAIVVVGDAEEVLPQVNSYSDKIEVFDTEGNPVDIVNYGKESNEETADVTGKWNLIIDFQGQKLPVTLILEQKANKISGSLESMLGRGEITDGKVKGNKFFGTAQIEAQGQSLEVLLQGDLPNENEVNGTLSAQMDGMPDLPFTGKKVS